MQMVHEEMMQNASPHLRAKLCLAGERGVGKTALVRQFALREAPDDLQPTFRARRYRKRVGLHYPSGERYLVDLEIWDGPGDAALFSLMDLPYFGGADAVLLVCDATRRETLHDAGRWVDAVRRVTGRPPARILVNKADLRKRALDPEAVRELLRPYRVPWVHLSATLPHHAERVFVQGAIQAIEAHRARRYRIRPRPLP